MAEARLPTGQKWVFVEDIDDTLGWMPVVQIDGGFSAITGTVSILGAVTVNGHVSITGTVVSIVNPVTIAEPVTVDGFVSITGSVSESWRVALTQDEANDDSDKTFTVPASQEWQILWLWVEYASFTGTATNPARQLEIQAQDSASDVIMRFQAGKTQANAETYNYLFACSLPDLTSFRDTSYLMTPLPPTLFLSAGQKLRIWDNKARDAANDDMNVQMQYAWRTV